MHASFEERIESGLSHIADACRQHKRTPVQVAMQVGRLRERNSRASALFEVDIRTRADGYAELSWIKLPEWREWASQSDECYLLRSNITDWTPDTLWQAYIQLTEAETAFHIHKSDLSLRPKWHHLEARVEAHILICFLAYVLWKTLSQPCKAAGLGN